jgi:hypothetical protein
MRRRHHPRIIDDGNGTWLLECAGCSDDRSEALPIGIGIPLRDRVTAERLAANHYRERERKNLSAGMPELDPHTMDGW